jgi:hypothetical protein
MLPLPVAYVLDLALPGPRRPQGRLRINCGGRSKAEFQRRKKRSQVLLGTLYLRLIWLLAQRHRTALEALLANPVHPYSEPQSSFTTILGSIWISAANLASRFRDPASEPRLPHRSFDSRSIPLSALTGGKACLEFAWKVRKGSAPTPVLNASPIIRADAGISKQTIEPRQRMDRDGSQYKE